MRGARWRGLAWVFWIAAGVALATQNVGCVGESEAAPVAAVEGVEAELPSSAEPTRTEAAEVGERSDPSAALAAAPSDRRGSDDALLAEAGTLRERGGGSSAGAGTIGLGTSSGPRRRARPEHAPPGGYAGLAAHGSGASPTAAAPSGDVPPAPVASPTARPGSPVHPSSPPLPSSPPRVAAVAPAAGTLAPTALPQSGVLASTFVGGRGAAARLEDLMDRGVMIGGAHVRLEAMSELGRLPYPVPSTEAVGLHAELERSELLTSGERVHLQIALMARQGEAPVRPRMDVRLVLDRSGSMTGEKWSHAVAAAHALLNRLSPGDTFGLISYSDDASLDFAPARVGDRRRAHAAIDRLAPGGGTNISSALEMVESQPPLRRGHSDVLLTILLSDGVATMGHTAPSALGSMARRIFDRSGTLTTAIGVGTDFDEETMISIAREGSGSYHFVRRSQDIAEILTDELEERALAVAQGLRLRIELGEGVVAQRVYGSRLLGSEETAAVRATEVAVDRRLARELGIARDRQRDEERGLRMHIPTFRRGDQHVVLLELVVPPGTASTAIASITLDYKDLISDRNQSAHTDVSATRTSDADDALASTVRPVKRTVLAFQAGDALQQAASALESGDLASARTLLSERATLLRTAGDLWHDRSLTADAQLLTRYQQVLEGAWPAWDRGSQQTLLLAMNYYGDRRMR